MQCIQENHQMNKVHAGLHDWWSHFVW